MLEFVAALQGFFFARNRWWETVVLLVVCFTLFRPQFWMDMVAQQFRSVPATGMGLFTERVHTERPPNST